MKTLNELDILELEIYSRIDDYRNTKNTDQNTEDDLLFDCYKKYQAIHKSYIDLIKNGDNPTKLEALKRALFIQWLGSFEPSFLTGITLAFETTDIADEISGIGLKEVQFVYEYLDSLIAKEPMDDELFEMLSYYACWEYVFEFYNFKDYRNLHHFVFNIANRNISWSPLIRKRDLSHRGQMGLYFLSLNNAVEDITH